MKRKILLSWSSGKDSAWALHVLQKDPHIDIVGLFTTVNQAFGRIAMHGVRLELLQMQAQSVGLPLHIIHLPHPCSNEKYVEAMSAFIEEMAKTGIESMAFGDLHLKDVRQYRENQLKDSRITPIFPIWGIPSEQLSMDMVKSDLRAIVTCVDPRQLPVEYVGREFNESFLEDIPKSVDPCGENGEFHTFVFDGPMFQKPIRISPGEIVSRDGFIFVDISSDETFDGLTPYP